MSGSWDDALLIVTCSSISVRLPYCGYYVTLWVERLPALKGAGTARFLCARCWAAGKLIENKAAAFSQQLEDREVAACEAYAADR